MNNFQNNNNNLNQSNCILQEIININEAHVVKRKEKSIKENINIIDIYCELSYRGENIINAKVSGSKNKVYDLRFKCSPKYNTVVYSCSCPDFKLRNGITCKHIFWFGRTYLNYMSPRLWKMKDIMNLIIKYSDYSIYPKGKNEKCPICFENIDYNIDNTINCVEQCKNSVHSHCWYKYTFTNYKHNCVICRADLLDIIREC